MKNSIEFLEKGGDDAVNNIISAFKEFYVFNCA